MMQLHAIGLLGLLRLAATDAGALQPDEDVADPTQPTSSKAPAVGDAPPDAPVQRPTRSGPGPGTDTPAAAPSPAPAAPPPARVAPAKNDNGPEPAPKPLHPEPAAEQHHEDAEPFRHRGTILDVRLGAVGCVGKLCERHKAKTGFRVDGFFGRNILGFVDLGLSGGYGTFKADVEPGSDGLLLYGLDRNALPPEAMALNLDAFTVNDARLDTVNGVFDVRVHFIPRGRFDPYAGVGIGYGLFRGLYGTDSGKTRVAFHGLSVPLQAGMVVFVHRMVAIGAQFDYLFTWYGGVTIRGAPGKLGAPISLIKDQAKDAGVDLPKDLPSMWTVGGVVHLRFGK